MRRKAYSNLQYTAWVAIFALLMQVLLPSIVRAAAPQNSQLLEICTAFGVKKMTVGDIDSSDSPAQWQDCPICNIANAFALPSSQTVFGLPNAVAVVMLLPVGSRTFSAIPGVLHLRGPPVLA